MEDTISFLIESKFTRGIKDQSQVKYNEKQFDKFVKKYKSGYYNNYHLNGYIVVFTHDSKPKRKNCINFYSYTQLEQLRKADTNPDT